MTYRRCLVFVVWRNSEIIYHILPFIFHLGLEYDLNLNQKATCVFLLCPQQVNKACEKNPLKTVGEADYTIP